MTCFRRHVIGVEHPFQYRAALPEESQPTARKHPGWLRSYTAVASPTSTTSPGKSTSGGRKSTLNGPKSGNELTAPTDRFLCDRSYETLSTPSNNSSKFGISNVSFTWLTKVSPTFLIKTVKPDPKQWLRSIAGAILETKSKLDMHVRTLRPVHYIPNLIVIHCLSLEIVPLVVFLVHRLMGGGALGDYDHVDDPILSTRDSHWVYDQALDQGTHVAYHVLQPFTGEN